LKCDFEDTLTCEYGQTPIQSSGLTFVDGKNGKGVLIDGNDALSYPMPDGLKNNWGIVDFWVKLNGNITAPNRAFFSVNGQGSWMQRKDTSYSSLGSFITPHSYFGLVLVDKNSNAQYVSINTSLLNDSNPFDDGEWHHVRNAYRKVGSEYKLWIYIDGIEVGNSSGDIEFDMDNLDLYIGSNADGTQQCDCVIDGLEVSFFPHKISPENSPYGIASYLQYHFRLGIENLVRLEAEAGIKWERGTGIRWDFVQPDSKSQWEWELFDQIFQTFKNYGIEPVPTLFWTPRWASSAPPGLPDNESRAYPPNDIEDWKDFVRECVRRYGCGPGGKCLVKHWEIWNEPDLRKFFDSNSGNTTADFFPLLQTGYETIKEVDPNAKVLFPGVTHMNLEPGGWTDRLLDLGAGQYCDIFNFHTYKPDNATTYVSQARQLMQNHGIENKPIWVTETSHEKTVDEQTGKMRLPIVFLQVMENNIVKVFWFNLRDGCPWAPPEQQDETRGLITCVRGEEPRIKPSYYAYQDMALWYKPPSKTTLTNPGNNTETYDKTPNFEWNAVNYNGSEGLGNYVIQISNESDFYFPFLTKNVSGLNFTSPDLYSGMEGSQSRKGGIKYYWRVKAEDKRGNFGKWSDTWILEIIKNLADFDGDGDVDIQDLTEVTLRFGLTSSDLGWNGTMDVVVNGEIDIYDLVFVAGRFT
ncbi:MAG: hypothetical protein JSW41_02960, partial [Candidatus Aenigmatarchaeota archaeon]